MLFVLLYALWIIFNGQVTGEILLIGLPVAGLIWFCALKLFAWSMRQDLRRLLRLPKTLGYLCWLLTAVIRAALQVIRRVWSRELPESAVAEFDPELNTALERIVLADSITLTPGTITLRAEDGAFRVHCLEKEAADTLGRDSMAEKVRRLR